MNVFGVLTRAYMAGEMPSPGPMTTLSVRTLQALYAISFIVYSLNVATDWLHTYTACKGWSVHFPLTAPLVFAMVLSCSLGSMLTFLLLVLCVENAFAPRGGLEPYRSGCYMILQKFGRWLVGFNCFRIAFLILLTEDAPMTFMNFWFISSCRIPGPDFLFWPASLATASTILSLVWRLAMLLFAYKHFWFFKLTKFQLEQINRESSTVDELKSMVGLQSDRLKEYDECWPVRFSMWKTMGKDNFNVEPEEEEEIAPPVEGQHHLRLRYQIESCAKEGTKAVGRGLCCCALCSCLCVGMCLTGCVPCLLHYCCRPTSLQHRHRFARSCTRICSTAYNISLLVLSACLTLTLLIVNCMWISSVHAIGHHQLPPELSQTCIKINILSHSFEPRLMPAVQSVHNRSQILECKPVFDSSGSWGFSWQRRRPTPWEGVHFLPDKTILRFWLDFEAGGPVLESPPTDPILYYDFVVQTPKTCLRPHEAGWNVPQRVLTLPWPYFRGCEMTYRIERVFKVFCNTSLVHGVV